MKHLLILCSLIFLLAACGGPPDTGAGVGSSVRAEARRDQVQTVDTAGSRQLLPANDDTILHVGEGVDVNSTGSALLQFADLLIVEITRNGQLQLREFRTDDESALVELVQTSGVLLGNFNPQKEINRRLSIDAGFAKIEVTGTRFLLAREEETPLWWIVGLDAESKDLWVEANGVRKDVISGQARWVAPVGEPSDSIEADMANLESWLKAVQTGQPQPEIGEIIWPKADVLSNTGALTRLPSIGEPFEMDGVMLTLSEKGMNGNPQYALRDCNSDGRNDIYMEMGAIFFDFRQVLGRVRALDVTILNLDDAKTGLLRVFDPAQEEIARRPILAGRDEYEVLDLRSVSGTAYHYAALNMTQGCFLGFSLTPPTAAGSEAPPRPAVPLPDGGGEVITPPSNDLADLTVNAPVITDDDSISCQYINDSDVSIPANKIVYEILVDGERVAYGAVSTVIAGYSNGWFQTPALQLPSSFTATCRIDINDAIDERDEDNNESEAVLPRPDDLPLPDLVAHTPTLVNGNEITCPFTNIGEGKVTQSDVYMDIYVNGERISSGTVNTPIAPGSGGWLRTRPAQLPSQFTVTCVIDARDNLAEPNENNNEATAVLTYSRDCPYATTADFVDAQQEMGLGCARSQAYGLTASWQPFTQGVMIWREDTNKIYVLINWGASSTIISPGQWSAYDNVWENGMPEYSCAEAEKRAELGTPVHFGFGYLWCSDTYMQADLGDPLSDESGDDRWFQEFDNGWIMYIGEWDNSIVVVSNDGYWALFPR